MPRSGIMSFFNPFGLNDFFAEFDEHFRHLDEVFDHGPNLFDNIGDERQQLQPSQPSCLHDFYVKPKCDADADRRQSLCEWGGMETNTDPSKMQVRVDVSRFKPEEITVKTVDDAVVIEGKHERVGEHEFISRHFTRRFFLPPNIEPESIRSSLADDGLLTIEAPAKKPQESASPLLEKILSSMGSCNERNVPTWRKGLEKYSENICDV
uniref:SHSP domain-containing protein n=1 Tax=Strigamia maritima TaxID=126957 RepID=T1JKG7_STRMM